MYTKLEYREDWWKGNIEFLQRELTISAIRFRRDFIPETTTCTGAARTGLTLNVP